MRNVWDLKFSSPWQQQKAMHGKHTREKKIVQGSPSRLTLTLTVGR